MESKIDFDRHKFAIASNNRIHGNIFRFNDLADLRVTDDFYMISAFSFGRKANTLHTNPDYKTSKYDGEFLAKTNESKEMIYTQAGKLPEVGMSAVYNKEEIIIIGFKGNGGIVFEYKASGTVDAICSPSGNESIKPIDQRTDEEKAIDFMVSNYCMDSDFGDAFIADAKAGKIHGISFARGKK